MNTVIPSLILALSVCLNIYLLFGKWTMAKSHEVNTNIKIVNRTVKLSQMTE